MDIDTATNLAAGIEEGTNSFQSSEVTASTFEIFAGLLKTGARRISKEKVQREAYPVGSIPGEVPQPQRGSPKDTSRGPVGSESTPLGETPQPTKAPKDWLEPKIYKGTTVS